jgi:hypothetical protein
VKTRLLLTTSLVLGLGVACTQTGNPPATRISGTNDLVASGSLLFITSTASNELRVLDLQPPNIQTPVDYVRAPNPLSPLSIPTLPAPIDLVTPTRYGPLGQPLTGDWVFVRGAGSPAISVIGSVKCPQQLREFGRIEPRSDAVITAMATRLTTDDTLAYLYLATFDGESSTLWEVVLPNQTRDRSLSVLGGLVVDPKTCPKYPGFMPPYTLRAIAPIPGAVVTALAALPTVWNPKDDRNPSVPGPLPEEKRLVVATRLLSLPPNPPGSLTEEGMITVIDTTGAGSVGPYPLVFAPFTGDYRTAGRSFPVKKLLSHGNVVRVTFDTDSNGNTVPDAGIRNDALGVQSGVADVVMDAGTRVFGLLDEASCAGRQDCVGIFAIDLDRPAADGGYFAIAIDGSDSLVNRLDIDGGVVRQDGGSGLPVRDFDSYYRPPNRAFFDGGIPAEVNRMLPIKFGNGFGAGVIQDITLQASGQVVDFLGFQRQFGLLGVATISGTAGSNILAQIFVFDGMTLRQINFTGDPPSITGPKGVLSSGVQAIFDGGPADIQVGQGIWPYSESIFVLYEGIVAGVSGEGLDAGLGNPTAPGGGIWPISVNNRNAVEAFVVPGDILVPVDSTNTECLFAFPLLDNGVDGGVLFDEPGGPFLHTREAALGPSLADGGVLVLDSGVATVTSGCPPPYSYNIRSSGLASGPLTVSGTRSGYLGRVSLPDAGGLTTFTVGANSTPSYPRFWRPSVDAGTPAIFPFLPLIGFGFNLRDRTDSTTGLPVPAVESVLTEGDTPELRGSGYQIDVLNGFAPASVGIDQAALNVALLLPGSITLYQRQVYPLPLQLSSGADRVFVLYPSANTILDFSPTTVTYTGLNSADIGLHF